MAERDRRLLKELYGHLNKESEALMEIILKDDVVRFHPLLLRALAPDFMNRRLSYPWAELDSTIRLRAISVETWNFIVYFYFEPEKTADAEVDAENVLDAAEMLNLEELKRYCGDALMQKITLENCIEVAMLAEKFKLYMDPAVDFLARRFHALVKSKDISKVPESVLIAVIESRHVIGNEDTVCEGVFTWCCAQLPSGVDVTTVLRLTESIRKDRLSREGVFRSYITLCSFIVKCLEQITAFDQSTKEYLLAIAPSSPPNTRLSPSDLDRDGFLQRAISFLHEAHNQAQASNFSYDHVKALVDFLIVHNNPRPANCVGADNTLRGSRKEDDAVIVIGNGSDETVLLRAWMPKQRRWVELPPPHMSGKGLAFVLSGRHLVATGGIRSQPTMFFSIDTLTWNMGPPLAVPRVYHAAVSTSQNDVVVVAGTEASRYGVRPATSSIERYQYPGGGQVGGGQWEEIGTLEEPVAKCTAVNLQGLIVAVGKTANSTLNWDVQIFLLSTGTRAILPIYLGGAGLKALKWTHDTAFFVDQLGKTHRLTFLPQTLPYEEDSIVFNQFPTKRPFALLREEDSDTVVVIHNLRVARGLVAVVCYSYQGNTQAVGASWFGVSFVGIEPVSDAFQVKLHGPFVLSPGQLF